MIDIVKTRAVLDQIAQAKHLLSLVRQLVLESEGIWIDGATVDMTFFVQGEPSQRLWLRTRCISIH